MAILAETYLHLKVQVTEESREATQKYLEYIGALATRNRFDWDVNIACDVEDGSLRTWLVVAGLIYTAITKYGDFREGIDYLVRDARAFSEAIIDKFPTDAEIPQRAIYRCERRLGLPGRIKRLLHDFDKIAKAVEGNDQTVDKDLEKAINQLREIEDELESTGDNETLKALRESIPKAVRDCLPERTGEHSPDRRIPPIPERELSVGQPETRRRRGRKPKEIIDSYTEPPPSPKFGAEGLDRKAR